MNVNQEQETKKICSFCKKEATQICSACKTVAYCSREHQKQHWKDHKPQCRPFEVCYSEIINIIYKFYRMYLFFSSKLSFKEFINL